MSTHHTPSFWHTHRRYLGGSIKAKQIEPQARVRIHRATHEDTRARPHVSAPNSASHITAQIARSVPITLFLSQDARPISTIGRAQSPEPGEPGSRLTRPHRPAHGREKEGMPHHDRPQPAPATLSLSARRPTAQTTPRPHPLRSLSRRVAPPASDAPRRSAATPAGVGLGVYI